MKPVLFILMLAAGCNNPPTSPAATSVSSGAAATVQPTDVMARLPIAVANAFRRDEPGINPTHVKARLYPDSAVHYLIRFVDKSGQMQTSEYRADGTRVS